MAPPRPPPAGNPGAALDAEWVREARVDTQAIEARAAALAAMPNPAREEEVAWLLRAVACLDLTTLAGDDTPARVTQLCQRARQPIRTEILSRLAAADPELSVGAVCVYPALVPTACRVLAGSGVPVAAVAGGFPAGQLPIALKQREIEWVVAAGASEVDVVISRSLALQDDWPTLFDEVRACKRAGGSATLKVILATGELGDLGRVARASRTCLLAGADFIKTSTGKEAVNATLPVGLVMAEAIRDYQAYSGHCAGLKPAGGLGRARDTLVWQQLVRSSLGETWLTPTLFRIGASSVLADVERRLATLSRDS